MIERLVILGATGDLTERLLLPALASLAAAGDLPPDFHLVGTGSRGWSQDQFRAHLHQALADQGNAATNLDEVIQEAQYRRVDVTEPGAVHHLVQEFAAAGPLGIYLALPTSLIGAALEAMQGLALPRGSRIAIEKPFGHDVGSAEHLNDLLGAVVGENAKDAVYRVDHVLAMSSLQNLLTLRAHNRMIGATW